METLRKPDNQSDIDFKKPVQDLIESARQLAVAEENLSDFIHLQLPDDRHLIIEIMEIPNPSGAFQRLARALNLDPQKVTETKIICGLPPANDSEPMVVNLEFADEIWREGSKIRFVKGSTIPINLLKNLPRREPQAGIYPVRDRDTIDWTRFPQGTPIDEVKAIKTLHDIQEEVSSLSSSK